MLTTQVEPARRPTPVDPPAIPGDLYRGFAVEGRRLVDVVWEQQRLHEARRWSVVELLERVRFEQVSDADRNFVWNAGRAELTTKPGADRLSRQSDSECRRFEQIDPALSAVMQACGTWSRYWNEEEAHHETVFNRLAAELGMPAVEDATFLEFRKIFPDDDMLRTLVLLAISEITATVNYGSCAKQIKDEGLRAIFKQVAADEMQHMKYFVSFAQALVQSGRFPKKNAFAVAHFFLKEGGDLYGAARGRVEQRKTHVNWWDHLESRAGDLDASMFAERKERLVFEALERITGVAVKSVEEVENTWMDLVGS